MTPFEQRLAATPRREIPAEWRAHILAAATQPRRSFPAFLIATFKSIFSFPHPLAWGALAAGWVAIATLNFSGPRGEALYAVTPKDYKGRLPSAQEYIVQMDLQRRLLIALAAEDFEPRPVYYLRRQDL
jgi:hypothetical protein